MQVGAGCGAVGDSVLPGASPGLHSAKKLSQVREFCQAWGPRLAIYEAGAAGPSDPLKRTATVPPTILLARRRLSLTPNPRSAPRPARDRPAARGDMPEVCLTRMPNCWCRLPG